MIVQSPVLVSENTFNTKSNLPDNVLYIIDGKESTKSSLVLLKPESIELIEVLKGKEAEKQYGEKGKNGVIKITTKNTSSPLKLRNVL
jgi:outer membrane receptor for ferrienterochelin and colicin